MSSTSENGNSLENLDSIKKAKEAIGLLTKEEFKMKKPCVAGYDTAILVSVLAYVVFMLYNYCCWNDNWIYLIVQVLAMVFLSVLEWKLVKALLTAREEALKPYRKAEQKLACVYDKIMDEYFDAAKKEVQKSSSQSNNNQTTSGTPKVEIILEERKKDAYIQILDAYVAHLKKSDNLRFENVEDIKNMVEGLMENKNTTSNA